MVRQALRRASRGWVDVVGSEGEGEEERSVSKRPGAEGAPWSPALVVEVGCEAEGAMRRD